LGVDRVAAPGGFLRPCAAAREERSTGQLLFLVLFRAVRLRLSLRRDGAERKGFSRRGGPSQYACFACPRAAVRDGVNRIAVTLASGHPATLEYFDLVLP